MSSLKLFENIVTGGILPIVYFFGIIGNIGTFVSLRCQNIDLNAFSRHLFQMLIIEDIFVLLFHFMLNVSTNWMNMRNYHIMKFVIGLLPFEKVC